MWRFLRHLLRDPTLAEDVTQETFVRVYRRLTTFHFESKFSTWVFQVARNAGIDALRSRDRRTRLHLSAPEPAPTEDPVTTAEVNAALDSLSPILREAVVMIEVLGLTYREAGEVLGAPEGTVKRRVHDARLDLARWASSTASEPGTEGDRCREGGGS